MTKEQISLFIKLKKKYQLKVVRWIYYYTLMQYMEDHQNEDKM